MLINKIIRHFSRLKLSVAKFFNFAFCLLLQWFQIQLNSPKTKAYLKKKPH
ncbi:hypothetical protein [Rheinheimera sp. A13L]|uniref:hypothetical protein n=1 Tax=Rheinheimera sp. A13L TaxID=506534 RepID=UPI00031789A0|nr:hypothetical protein [Rheinheimera sp. A13L]